MNRAIETNRLEKDKDTVRTKPLKRKKKEKEGEKEEKEYGRRASSPLPFPLLSSQPRQLLPVSAIVSVTIALLPPAVLPLLLAAPVLLPETIVALLLAETAMIAIAEVPSHHFPPIPPSQYSFNSERS